MNIRELSSFSFEPIYDLLKSDTDNWRCKNEGTDKEYIFLRSGTKRFGGTVRVDKESQSVLGFHRVLTDDFYQDSGSTVVRMLDLWYVLNKDKVRSLTLEENNELTLKMSRFSRMSTSLLFGEAAFRAGNTSIFVQIGDFYYRKGNAYSLKYWNDGSEFLVKYFVNISQYEDFRQGKIREGYLFRGDTWYHPSIPWYDSVPLPVWIEEGEFCHTCGALYLVHQNPHHNDGECYSCHEDVILPYSTRAERKFDFKVGKDRFAFLGVELEVSCGDNPREYAAKSVKKLLKDHCILKSDGSINNGFEIVSAPAHIDVHKENFSKFFDNLPEELCEDESCGMHVHIDRKALSVSQISRMSEFMNSNLTFVEAIGGRRLNSYCMSDASFNKSKAFKMKVKGNNRYSAINLCPDKTVEIRIFASTLDKGTFERNLEFVKALVKFSRPGELDVSVKETLTANHFIEWIGKQPRTDYPVLKPYLLKNFSYSATK